MSKFKIGDRVRRIEYGFGSMSVGSEGIVEKSAGNNVTLRGHDWKFNADFFELVAPALTITTGKFYRTASGAVTGRVTVGDTGFEAVVDGKVRIFDAAGGAVHGGDDIVEEWVPKVGERVRLIADNCGYGKKGDVVTVLQCDWKSVLGKFDRLISGDDEWFIGLEQLEPLPVAAPAQSAATLKIDAGRYYRTRDGRKVGPLVETGNNEYWPFKWPEKTMYYKANGYSCPGSAHQHRNQDDLIAEWVDEPTAPVSAQVDAIAEEYGPVVSYDNGKPKFKVGDRVVYRKYMGGEDCYGTVDDVSVDGKRVHASDWSVGAEDGYLSASELELADTKADATLHLKFTSDFSELDAAILVRKKKLKKLIKLAAKAGIQLREAA